MKSCSKVLDVNSLSDFGGQVHDSSSRVYSFLWNMPAQQAAVAIQLWPVTISTVYRTSYAKVKSKKLNVKREIVSVSCHLDAISVLGLKIS